MIMAGPVRGELVILAKINHFLTLLLGANAPKLLLHEESIPDFRPHSGHDFPAAHAWRRGGPRHCASSRGGGSADEHVSRA